MSYLVDANVLIYATNRRAPAYERANSWLAEQLAGPRRTVGIPWLSALAFQRIMTNPRLFSRPLDPAEAWGQLTGWFALPSCWIPNPGDEHTDLVGELIAKTGAVGNLVSDAHLAALAREHGLTIASADADFAKFPDVRWVNPVES